MYAEEYLPDDANIDFDNTDISIEETSSMDTEERDKKITVELYKRLDPDYYSFKRTEVDFDGNIKFQKVPVFSTQPQGIIRNAPTGIKEEHRSGTKADDLYFTVKDTAIFTKTDTNKEPRKLFYRSPEEFERHFKMNLPQSIKEKWQKKNLLAKAIHSR
jgi:hypothetical protein